MKRATITAKGKVQEAGYRAKVVAFAKKLNIKGYVENLDNGDVRILAEGKKEDLKEFIKRVEIKNEIINVSGVSVKWSEPTDEFVDFKKIVKSGETDERLDTAAAYLKELIGVTREGVGYSRQSVELARENIELTKQSIELTKENVELTKDNLDVTKQVLCATKEGNEKICEKLDSFREDTVERFDTTDRKFGKISDKMDNIDKTLKGLTDAILKLASGR